MERPGQWGGVDRDHVSWPHFWRGTKILNILKSPQHPQHPPQNVDDLLEIAEMSFHLFILHIDTSTANSSEIRDQLTSWANGSLSHYFTTGFFHPRRPGLLNHQQYFREIKQAAKIYGEYKSHFSSKKAWSLGWFYTNPWRIHGTIDILISIVYINIHYIYYIYTYIFILYIYQIYIHIYYSICFSYIFHVYVYIYTFSLLSNPSNHSWIGKYTDPNRSMDPSLPEFEREFYVRRQYSRESPMTTLPPH